MRRRVSPPRRWPRRSKRRARTTCSSPRSSTRTGLDTPTRPPTARWSTRCATTSPSRVGAGFRQHPQLRRFLTSEDKTTWVLPVSLEGELGTPRAFESFNRVADIVEHNVAKDGPLTVYITGPAATVADLTVAGEQDRLPIEIAIAVLVLACCCWSTAARSPCCCRWDDRIVAGHRAGCGGRLLAADRLGRVEPVHRFSERDHGRRRNGLRGLPHQPLSRLSAGGC